MNKISRWILTVAVVFMLMMDYAHAQVSGHDDMENQRGKWRQGVEDRMQELFDELKLSEDQKSLLEDHRSKHRQQMSDLRKSMRDLRQRMQQELQKSDLDMEMINQLQGQIKDTQGRILDYRLEGILTVHKILTPEQYEKFSKEMQKRKENFRKKIWGEGPVN